MYTFSDEHKEFLRKLRREKILVIIFQYIIICLFLLLWELAARFNFINTFLFSSPSNIVNTVVRLYNSNELFSHIWITVYETLISFLLASMIGLLVGSLLWWNKFLAKILEPYLTIINSLPKVALGPLIIIWVGASTKSIIVMALLISSFISIINIYNGFISSEDSFITLLRSFKASKKQIYLKVILPSNRLNIINVLKINISMSLIGVIMGELLVSKKGLGYLIVYGSQVFNINLVITATFILGIVSFIMYYGINCIEKKIIK